MKRLLSLFSLFAIAATALAADGRRLFIVTDVEGVGGVQDWDEQTLPGQRRFEESKRLLTGEVNAAVQGAFDGGATEVVIWDGHGGSRTLSIADIHSGAKLIQGKSTPATFYFDDGHYDGLIFVGQHAKAGSGGLMAHSQSRNVRDITINGKSVGEAGQAAAIAGYFKTPVIMLTGDQAACDEIRGIQPKAETVAVKRKVGKVSALSLSHAQACEQIRAAARRAVQRIPEFSPWVIEGPVEMRFEFYPEAATGSEPRPVPDRIYKGKTVLEAFEQWIPR